MSVSKVLRSSLIFRAGEAVLRLRFPWHVPYAGFDDLTDFSLVDELHKSQNFVAVKENKVLTSFSLARITDVQRFRTTTLPCVKDVTDAKFFVQAMICLKESSGWLSVFRKSGEILKSTSLIKFEVEVMRSVAAKDQKHSEETKPSNEGVLFYHGFLEPSEVELIRVTAADYKRNKTFGKFTQSNTYQAVSTIDESEVLNKEFIYSNPVAHGEPKEAYILKNINHECVRGLQCAYYPEDATKENLVLDLYEKTLEEYLNESNFELKERNQIVYQIASGLVELHSKNVVHMDLAPENILMTGIDTVIGDVGMAVHFDGEKCKGPGNRMFNQLYASPELAADGEDVSKSDMYTVGLVHFATHIDCKDKQKRDEKVRSLKALAKSFKKKTPEAKRRIWERSALSREFHGDADLLIELLSEPDDRPTSKQLKERLKLSGS